MKIAICGNYGVKNAGDEAILLGLQNLLTDRFGPVDFLVMGKGNLLPFGFRSLISTIGRPGRLVKLIKHIKGCEMFILGGGGLFTDEESVFSPVFWALHGIVANLVGRSVYCLGVSVGRLGGIGEYFVKKIFSISKAVVLRDQFSYNLVHKKWGIKCELGSDLALHINYVSSTMTQEKKYVVMSLRPIKNRRPSLYKVFAQACDFIVAKYGYEVRLLPFHSDPSEDGDILTTIFEHSVNKQKIQVVEYPNNISALLDLLGNAEMVIAMRLHAGILALKVGTPFLPISYMSKVSNFWSEFSEIGGVEMADITEESLIAHIAVLHKETDVTRGDIVAVLRKLMERSVLALHRALPSG